MHIGTSIIIFLVIGLCSAQWMIGVPGLYRSKLLREYPEFCGNLKCPKFNITSVGDDYEERCYEESMWASISVQAPHKQSTSFGPMFQSLYKYISGENDQKIEIPMTAPVLVTVKMSADKNDYLDIKMHFFIPPTNLTIPKPTADAIKLVNYPKICVYVRVFSGYQTSVNKNLLLQRRQLTEALDKTGRNYNKNDLIYAGYDSPWKIFHRHNEIMVRVEPKESASTGILAKESGFHTNDVA
ncbi:heme-binding protein 2 isoform X2 [Hydra vulgaris]|uniref:Heme-binding protein 2 isoform X2 n=1 Tax=Hydra vulgaris TaxID=6087 RepID=A0ABM4BSL8_HYDVU